MATLSQLIQKYDPKNIGPAIAVAGYKTGPIYSDKLREQLLTGKGSDGKDLTPGYLEDPYFKTRGAAARYAAWKQKITPNPLRNLNAPNLFIVGTYHRSLFSFFTGDAYVIESLAGFGAAIEKKYSGKATKLGGVQRAEFINEQLLPELKKQLHL